MIHREDTSAEDKYITFAFSPSLQKMKQPPPLKNFGVQYLLDSYDVVCGRGNACRKHPGNINFRNVIEDNLSNYITARTKTDKSIVVSQIASAIREEGGDFVRYEESTGEWHQVCERALREKVGQSLRDVLHTQYRSSTKAKKHRKRFEHAQQHEDVINLLGPNSVMTRLTNEIKEETPDFQVANMLNAANICILQELKRLLAIQTPSPPPE